MAVLRDLVEPRTGTCSPATAPTEPFTYVDVAAIDNEAKAIVGARVLLGVEAPSRARRLIRKDDVLVSTIRPNLNAVAVVPPSLDGQIASTGFCVLRAKKCVLPEFLYFYVRSKPFVEGLCKLVAGAMYPAVTEAQVLEQTLSLPSMQEQRRIVDLLARAEGIVRLRREAQQKAAELIPAIFIDMFGDPATNSKGWPIRLLGDLLEMPLRNGISPARSGRHSANVLTLSAITRGQFDDSAVKSALFASPVAESDEVRTSDFLICRGNGNKSMVGAGCFPNRDMRGVAFPDTAIAVRPNRSLLAPHFLAGLWRTAFVRHQIDAVAKTTNGTFKINQTGVAGIRLVVPPMSEQLRFGSSVQAIESLSMQQADALTKATATFDAIMSQAFA